MERSKFKSKELDALFAGIMMLEKEEECYQFFEDLCTVTELNAIAQRFKVAKMLDQKKTTHAIAEETGASTATISRVNRCLHYGTGGYGLVIGRMKK
ncbi:MAG TPA: TrpR-like protein YerC/YecD [Clostridiales bacterium]|nr:TrpR-like protein YerC/YecD [Clostridiales bacterium]